MQYVDYSLVIGSGGLFGAIGIFIGFGLKTWLNLRSQKIQQECFYSEYFCKIRAERVIKFIDTLNFFVVNTHNSSVNQKEHNKNYDEAKKALIYLHCIIDDNNYKVLMDFFENWGTDKTNNSNDRMRLNESLLNCQKMLKEYLPKDYLFKK